MKKMLSVFLAGLIMVMQVVPAFSYDRTESIKSTEATYDRCDDFYAQSYNNYVVENGFVFDLDTQTIVQFNASQYIESLIESTLDGSLEEENIGQEMSNMYVVVIPETIAGKTVRFIGNYSFANISIKQVFIPSCVEKIGDRAFENSGLQSVCLSEGLLEIGRNAFKGSATGTTIVVPSTVKYVDFHSNHHSTAYSFVFKSEDTKYNEFGYEDDEYAEPITKSDIVIDENATIPTLFEDTTSKSLDTYLWCHHTEANGFTYAYPISISWACSLCGENFSELRNSKCPYCQETITEEDGTWLTDISDEDYYALYKETHEGMELREYLIHKLVEAGLIIDANTPIASDVEIQAYIKENLHPYHFSWKDGKLVSSYYKWITDYDASLDESPEEITITDVDARITDVTIFDNLEQLETLNFNILSLIDWADYNSEYSYSWDGFSSLEFQTTLEKLNATLLYAGILSLANLGNLRLFSDCNNLKQVNITCDEDVGNYTEEELTLIKAQITDYLSLAFKYCFRFDISSVDYTFPSFIDVEIVDGAVYYNNRSVLLALLEDKETYKMPSSVTDVSTFALSSLKIDNVIWSENCSYIPFGCFAKSTIKSINFNGVTTIEDFAFYKTNINSIVLPESVTTLGSCVFSGTTISDFELSETVTTVGSALFANCLELKSITINCNLSKVTLNHYPFFMSQTNKLGETTTTYSMMSYSYYAECGGPYDNTIFGFVPNLETLNIGSKVNDIYVVGYFPALIKITVDENNPSFYAKDNFLMRYDDEVAVLAPQGANFYDVPKDFPLENFLAQYVKPVNSMVASTSQVMLYCLDANHIYASGVESFIFENEELYMGLLLSIPNYLHTSRSDFQTSELGVDYSIPETLTIVHEEKQIEVKTDNGAKIDIELRNVTDKVYKIPCWYELTKEDLQISETAKTAWYFGNEEFISLDLSLLNSGSYYFAPIRFVGDDNTGYGGYNFSTLSRSDSTLKAIRFVGDIDLLEKPDYWTQLRMLNDYFSGTNVYNLELSPNTVKSVFPNDTEMHNIIDKYTWDDGYLHFTSGGRFPVLQTDNPTQDGLISNFVNEFFVPWYNAFSSAYSIDGIRDIKSYLLGTDYKFVKVADMNGIEYDLTNNAYASVKDEMFFDMLVQSEYEIAQENLPDLLTSNNITTFAEFKQYYIDNYITFDKEAQTLINISSVTGMTPQNLYIPSKINGVEVKNVSVLVPLFVGSMGCEVASMYIPSTVEQFGCSIDNIDQAFTDAYLKAMMSAYGFTTIEQLDAYLLEDSGMEISAVTFNVNDDADIKNGLGIICDPDNIIISSANEYFKKRTNAVGNTEIISADGKICYAVGKNTSSDIYLSGLSNTYAPYSLGHYDENSSSTYYYDVMGVESDFQSCSLSLIMAVDGFMCPDCEVVLKKTRTSCPICSTTELAVMQMDMQTMEFNYGASWQQSIFDGSAETKRNSNVIAYNENSSFLTHCTEEHDGKACCSYVDPSTLTGYQLDNYTMTKDAYNNASSDDGTTEPNGLYNITTDTDDVVTYSDEEFFETQFFVIENQPEQYVDAGVIVVEPFQKTETVTLALKKGTVNAKSTDIDTGELITEDFEYGIYSKDNSLVTTFTAVNGLATLPDIAYGEYYMKQLNTPSYENLNKTVEFSIKEDGQIVDVEFNNYIQTTYTVVIPEYIESVPAGEEMITQSVVATDVVLRPGRTLNITCEYSGELTLREDNNVKLGYKMKNNNDNFASGDVVLTCPAGDSSATYTTSIGSILTASPNYAGVYTDTVTFSSKVSEETNYSTEDIENNPLLYGIGETKPEYVVAEFNEDYTEVVISKNGEDSDGRMMDWVNSDALKCPMVINNQTIQRATIEEGVVNLGVNSFNAANRSKGALTTVSLPSTLKEIELNSFRNQGLVSLELPANLETIGQRAFSNCNKITGDLIIPDSVVSIGHYAFEKCNGFDGALVIGDGTRFIGNGAFTGDTNVIMKFTSLDLGESIEYIGYNAFQLCHYISNEIVFPDTLKVIGDFAFNHCSRVANETLVIPASVEVIGGIYNPNVTDNTTTLENYMNLTVCEYGSHNFYDFGVTGFKEFFVEDGNKTFKDIDGVLYSKDGKRLISYPACKEGTSYEIPEGVEYIDELAFDCSRGNATNYLKTLTLPDSYTIKKYGEQSPSVINYENSLVNALYIASGVEEVLVKDTNTKYQSVDGCLYSKDGTICWYIPAYKNTVNIVDGCTTLEGAYYNPFVVKPDKSNVYVINIPASVTTISVYNDTYNTIKYMNEMVDNTRFDFTVNVDANNPAYTVDANGYLVKK